jgi:predicted PurR-regulated permease PerM
VPPLVSIIMITTLGIVLGLPGMLIGEPLSAAAIFLVRHLYVNPIEGREPAATPSRSVAATQ